MLSLNAKNDGIKVGFVSSAQFVAAGTALAQTIGDFPETGSVLCGSCQRSARGPLGPLKWGRVENQVQAIENKQWSRTQFSLPFAGRRPQTNRPGGPPIGMDLFWLNAEC